MTYNLIHVGNLALKNFKVPSIVVQGDIVDFRVFNEEEAYAKMEAFVETMDYYRKIRKKKVLNGRVPVAESKRP